MATSLWPLALAFAFGDLLVPWPLEICLYRGQGRGHGQGPKLVATKESGSCHQTQGNVPKPQAMANAPGHGHGSGPKLMGREGSGYRVLVWDVGYGVQGIGWWVLGIGYWEF